MSLGFDPYLAFGWCILAGFVMSMGAGGGGILAGIGHISILGIGDPNMIKAVNQILEFSSRIVSVPIYHRQRRIVWSLAAAFGVGSPLGAIVGSWFSKNLMSDMTYYRPAFGALIALVAARVLYEGWGARALIHAGLRKATAASKRASQKTRGSNTAIQRDVVPRSRLLGWNEVSVHFGGEHFDFSLLSAAAGGFVISLIGSAVGVGGGFLVNPFMASILFFPMYLVIGTGLVALIVPLAVSVLTYIVLSVRIDWSLVAIEVPGILVGSFLGPVVNQYMNEKALKTFVALVLLAIGLYYVFR